MMTSLAVPRATNRGLFSQTADVMSQNRDQVPGFHAPVAVPSAAPANRVAFLVRLGTRSYKCHAYQDRMRPTSPKPVQFPSAFRTCFLFGRRQHRRRVYYTTNTIYFITIVKYVKIPMIKLNYDNISDGK